MSNKKDNKQREIKHQVWACEGDLFHPIILLTAQQLGLITIDSGIEFEYNETSLANVLEKMFGFKDGWYEKELLEVQKGRFGNQVMHDKHRFFGIERTDKEWLNCGMASDEIKQLMKFGEVL